MDDDGDDDGDNDLTAEDDEDGANVEETSDGDEEEEDDELELLLAAEVGMGCIGCGKTLVGVIIFGKVFGKLGQKDRCCELKFESKAFLLFLFFLCLLLPFLTMMRRCKSRPYLSRFITEDDDEDDENDRRQ